MKKELQITISGVAASGKSSMLLYLEKLLTKRGFNVELVPDTEIMDYGTEEKFRRIVGTNLKERMRDIKKSRKVKLNTVQLKRNS